MDKTPGIKHDNVWTMANNHVQVVNYVLVMHPTRQGFILWDTGKPIASTFEVGRPMVGEA